MKRVACLLASSNVPSGWTQSDFRAVRVSGATSKQERVAAGIVFKP